MNNKQWLKSVETAVESEKTSQIQVTIHSQESTYHELSDSAVVKKDITELVNENLLLLEDLHARQRFLLREIRYLLKLDEVK